MSKPQADLGVPSLLGGRYELEELLATGAMASVWRGRDLVLGRVVAVKILHPQLAADEALRERFRQEAIGAARLARPGIVAVYDSGNQDAVAYVVMELVEGTTLRDLLRNGPLAPTRAARITRELAEILDYAHNNGIVHGGVKPGNVLITKSGAVKLTDFALAQVASGDGLAPTEPVFANTAYLAPEQVTGRPVDRRTDVYALGVCLYEMLTGRTPFKTGQSVTTVMAHLQAEPLPPRALRAGVPRQLEAITMRAIAKSPSDRYASAQDMASALGRWEAGHGPTTAPIEPVPATVAPSPGTATGFLRGEARWIVWALAIVGTVALLVIVGLAVAQVTHVPLGGRSTPAHHPPATSAAPVTPVHVLRAIPYDPYGDNVEGLSPDLAIDGQLATFWETECYTTAAFGNLKPGLGLILDVGQPRGARTLHLDLVAGGATAEVLGTNGVIPPTQTSWTSLAPARAVGVRSAFSLPGTAYRYYLIWFTRLPYMPLSCASTRTPYRVEVAEAALSR